MVIPTNRTSGATGLPVTFPRSKWAGQAGSNTHYVACWSEGSLLLLCGHQHEALSDAVGCVQGVDGCIKAFTDGQERCLTNEERKEVITELVALYSRAKEISREDPLTGALTRRGFVEVLENESTRSQKYLTPLTLVSLDLDDFRAMNDALGHGTGDLILKVTSWTMQSTLREVGSLARFHGDEFAILLPETETESARMAVGELREALMAAMKTYHWDVTFSIVAVTFNTPPATLDCMFEVAERHMRLLKRTGKNRTSYFTWSDVRQDAVAG